MGFFKQLLDRKTSMEEDNCFTKPQKEYLESLLQITNKKFKQFEYRDVDESDCDVFYLSKKELSYVGLQVGLSERARFIKNNLKESTNIRSNCKNYIKLLKKDEQLVKLESYVNGKIDCIYLAYYENDYRYLFPYMDTGHKYPTYISVTHFENNIVLEEYLVQKDSIIYSQYGKQKDNKVDYYYINYIPNGKYPILEEKSGYYLVDSLEYVETEYYVWNQDR